MDKQIIFSIKGERADIGEIIINRILPNRFTGQVGPFVFLDHVLPVVREGEMRAGEGGAHPHRGIATLTYVILGEAEHFDSQGNRAKISSGGAQWMKAGNGIIHDETLNIDKASGSQLTHALQFWINLPPEIKKQAPEYMALQAAEIPVKLLDGDGWLKVIAGDYEALQSPIPAYSEQYIYHIHLHAGKNFILKSSSGIAYAAFIISEAADINDRKTVGGELLVFHPEEGSISIHAPETDSLDLILFGGAPYTHPVVAQGPFVMNSHGEIAEAYHDFHLGKYGEVVY